MDKFTVVGAKDIKVHNKSKTQGMVGAKDIEVHNKFTYTVLRSSYRLNFATKCWIYPVLKNKE